MNSRVFKFDNQQDTTVFKMIAKDKITEIFYIVDDFSKNIDAEIEKQQLLTSNGKVKRNYLIIFLLMEFN